MFDDAKVQTIFENGNTFPKKNAIRFQTLTLWKPQYAFY